MLLQQNTQLSYSPPGLSILLKYIGLSVVTEVPYRKSMDTQREISKDN